ncbi:uncharacterized protein LOC112872382 [Panicum hallii]|uniref:uncharacterized protein LOC112872382 n=1 Tax=Panicum hallii TaxID=206008 RepID=UPI000DF4CC1F|nr:uncharacterized protein LOC112872382 [Panicum hallii]
MGPPDEPPEASLEKKQLLRGRKRKRSAPKDPPEGVPVEGMTGSPVKEQLQTPWKDRLRPRRATPPSESVRQNSGSPPTRKAEWSPEGLCVVSSELYKIRTSTGDGISGCESSGALVSENGGWGGAKRGEGVCVGKCSIYMDCNMVCRDLQYKGGNCIYSGRSNVLLGPGGRTESNVPEKCCCFA